MKIYSKLSLLIMLLFPVLVFCQKGDSGYEVVMQDDDLEGKWSTLHEIYGADDEYVYGQTFVKKKGRIFELKFVKYDLQGKVVKTYDTEDVYQREEKTRILFNDKIVELASDIEIRDPLPSKNIFTKNPPRKLFKYYVQTFNKEDFKLDKTKISIGEKFQDMIRSNLYSIQHFNTPRLIPSKDENKLLVVFREGEITEGNQKIIFHVFDKDMKLEWKKEVDFKKGTFGLSRFQIDEEGTVYILCEKSVEREESKPSFNFQLLKLTNDKDEIEAHEIEYENKEIIDLAWIVEPNDVLVCAGLFGQNKVFKNEDGSIFFKFDLKKNEMITLSEEVLSKNSKFYLNDNLYTFGFGIDKERYNLQKSPSGRYVLVYENFKFTTESDGRGNETSRTYHFGDLIVNQYGEEGDFMNSSIVSKTRTTTSVTRMGSGYSRYSYRLSVQDDKSYFVYNAKRLDNLQDAVTSKLGNAIGTGVLLELDLEGNQSRSLLFPEKETWKTVGTKESIPTKDGFFLYRTYDAKFRTGALIQK